VLWNSKLVILDEPTAALGVKQSSSVLDLARRLRDRQVGIVFISHSLEIVMEIADYVVVLRQGQVVFEGAASEVGEPELLHLMAGLPIPPVLAQPQIATR